jgi:hypothetical protein
MTATPDAVLLVVFTDGRDQELRCTLASAREHLKGNIEQTIIVNDSGQSGHHARLQAEHGEPGTVVVSWGARKGFGGSIAAAWELISALNNNPPPLVFHLEDDFLFNRDVDLEAMADLLRAQPDLVQIALRRQAWNDVEKAAGGVIQVQPEAYRQRRIERDDHDLHWIEHRLYFTTNPSLYPRSLCKVGWPTLPHSEGLFTHQMIQDPAVRFGLWGRIEDDPWVEHVGHTRVGAGY